MKRPSVYILAYLLAGIIFGQHFTDIKYAIIFMSAVIIVTGIICFLSKIWKCSFLILILVTGIFVGYKSTMPKDINLYSIAQNNVKADIRCEVLDLSKDYGGNLYKYIVSAEHIENEKVNSDIYGKAILYTGANLNSGDVIIINGKIRPIEKKKNKTDFDSYSYYKSYGIEYKISITDLSEISHRTNFNSIVKAIRNKFANNFDLILPQDKASFMKAIILGDRADLDEELYQTFKDGGVAHIVAISGLHISINSCSKVIHKNEPPEMDGFYYFSKDGGSFGKRTSSKLSNGPFLPERWSLVYSAFSSTSLSISFLA